MTTLRPFFRCAAMAVLSFVLAAGSAHAQSVALTGVVGTRALLVVNGGSPKMVPPGETYQGVKVISAQSDQAQVEVAGKRFMLRMGDSPIVVGGGAGPGGGTRIVLPVDTGGHFFAQGAVNGRAASFVVDTGATSVAMGASDATRFGIDFTKGQPVRMNTANGQTIGYVVRLNSVRINDVEVFDVEAVVTPISMPVVLLGNSFLGRFSMKRESDQMVLERRY